MSRKSSLRQRYARPSNKASSATSASSCKQEPGIRQLSNELSCVINRVRRAYGPLSMAEVARSTQMKRAEDQVNRAAWDLQRGLGDSRRWHEVLCEYEAVWMDLLDQIRQSERHAA